MATAQPTIAEIVAQAQALQAEIATQGVNASDKASIVSTAKKLIALLNSLQPHVNAADQAFGGNTAAASQITDLRNKLNKVVAAYSS